MEVEILQEMIVDRDSRIQLIQRKSDEQITKEKRLREELDQAQDRLSAQKIDHMGTKTTLLHRRQRVMEQLESMQRDLQQQGASLHTYAGVLQQQAVDMVGDSSYVMRMQAQLCKAMHSMGIIDHQMELAKKHADALLKLQKEALTSMTEEKSQVELDLMNDLMKIDTARREIEDELTTQMEDIRKEITKVENEIEENEGSEEDPDDDEQEEDEEEKAAKEELMKMLREQRDKIEQLEQETEQQAEMIEDLEAELRGEPRERPNRRAESHESIMADYSRDGEEEEEHDDDSDDDGSASDEEPEEVEEDADDGLEEEEDDERELNGAKEEERETELNGEPSDHDPAEESEEEDSSVEPQKEESETQQEDELVDEPLEDQ